MTADAHDVTAYLVLRRSVRSTVRLHALLYFAHVAAWRAFGEPWLRQPIEAWEFGPVVPDLAFTYGAVAELPDDLFDASAMWRLTSADRAIVDAQVARFAHLADADLSQRAMADRPYRAARQRIAAEQSVVLGDRAGSVGGDVGQGHGLAITPADLAE